MEKGNLSQLCDFIMRVSIDNYFFSINKTFKNIVKITLWTKIAVVLLLQFLVVFRVSSYTLCVCRSQQSQMAAPMGQDTINFNSNNCNNLRLLFRTGSVPCDHKEALLSLDFLLLLQRVVVRGW